MKKSVKRILWAVGIIVGIVLVAGLVFYLKFSRATKSITPSETIAINDSVWVVKDNFVNAYIFKTRNGYLMVDAGYSKKGFKRQLDKLGIPADQITNILLTHTDGDHIGAMGLFTNPSVYIHREEEQMINGTNGKMKYYKPVWKYGPYKLLDSNDTLILNGLGIKVLHTPGHTPGSCCFIIGKDYLLTGDNLSFEDGKYRQFMEMFNMDTPTQIESLRRLPDPINFRYILTAHYGVVKVSE